MVATNSAKAAGIRAKMPGHVAALTGHETHVQA